MIIDVHLTEVLLTVADCTSKISSNETNWGFDLFFSISRMKSENWNWNRRSVNGRLDMEIISFYSQKGGEWVKQYW